MPDLSKRIDPLSFPIVGLLGAFACGPIAPQDTDGGSTGGPSTDATDSTTGRTTDPTTDPPDPTRPTTTEPPMPECALDSDCAETYCGYCVEGMCRESVGCCGEYAAVRVGSKWRCSPPYDCYSDDECGFGYVCAGSCIESPPIPLPGCEPPDGFGTEWNLGDAPTAFVLADLDGDLDLDLAAAEPGSGSIEIALNDGAGNFILAGAFGVGPEGSGDLALAAGDLDGDGDLDLAVTRREADGVLRLLFNDGAVFTVGEPLPVAPLPVQVFIADVNGDAALDLLTVSEGSQPLGVQLGDGTGKFSPAQPGTADAIDPRASVGDITLDGVADLLAPVANGGTFAAWAGGDGPLLDSIHSFVAPNPAGMAVLSGDLDLQGLPDIVLVHPQDESGMVHVWAGTGAAQWTFGRQRFTTSLPLTGGLLGDLDILPGPSLLGATGQHNIVVLPGDGKGGFSCELNLDIPGISAPALLAVADIDSDGRDDIIAGGLGSTTISIFSPLF